MSIIHAKDYKDTREAEKLGLSLYEFRKQRSAPARAAEMRRQRADKAERQRASKYEGENGRKILGGSQKGKTVTEVAKISLILLRIGASASDSAIFGYDEQAKIDAKGLINHLIETNKMILTEKDREIIKKARAARFQWTSKTIRCFGEFFDESAENRRTIFAFSGTANQRKTARIITEHYNLKMSFC